MKRDLNACKIVCRRTIMIQQCKCCRRCFCPQMRIIFDVLEFPSKHLVTLLSSKQLLVAGWLRQCVFHVFLICFDVAFLLRVLEAVLLFVIQVMTGWHWLRVSSYPPFNSTSFYIILPSEPGWLVGQYTQGHPPRPEKWWTSSIGMMTATKY